MDGPTSGPYSYAAARGGSAPRAVRRRRGEGGGWSVAGRATGVRRTGGNPPCARALSSVAVDLYSAAQRLSCVAACRLRGLHVHGFAEDRRAVRTALAPRVLCETTRYYPRGAQG